MKVAIDLDGTLGKHTRVLLPLANSLLRDGHEVFVLTAAAGELAPQFRPPEVARRLRAIGCGHLRFVCLESKEKPHYCESNSVDLLIDDTKFDLRSTVQLIPS